MSERLIMLGAGGHARVLRALLRASGRALHGVCDPALAAAGQTHWDGVPVLGADEAVLACGPAEVGLVNGLGQLVRGTARAVLYRRFRALGYAFPVLVHPHAWVAADAQLAEGVQIMAGAIVQPGCSIGENSIINTRAAIDHDCSLGADVHVAPGAVLCGTVTIGQGAFVGAGATLIQAVQVGAGCVVGAGTTLVKNVSDGASVMGSPVRFVSPPFQSI